MSREGSHNPPIRTVQPERPLHIAGARPPPPPLGVPPEPIAHQPMEQPHLLGDLGDDRVEIGARPHARAWPPAWHPRDRCRECSVASTPALFLRPRQPSG